MGHRNRAPRPGRRLFRFCQHSLFRRCPHIDARAQQLHHQGPYYGSGRWYFTYQSGRMVEYRAPSQIGLRANDALRINHRLRGGGRNKLAEGDFRQSFVRHTEGREQRVVSASSSSSTVDRQRRIGLRTGTRISGELRISDLGVVQSPPRRERELRSPETI